MPDMKNKFWAHETTEISPKAKIGPGTKIWQNSQVLKNSIIGKNCTIGHNCFIGSKAKLGNGVKLESNIDVWDLVTIEDYVFVGPSVVFTNDPNPRAKYSKKQYPEYGHWLPTLIKQGSSIGANATIICGHTIGQWAFVGAGSVITKDVPDYALVVGVPAKQIGWICECGAKLRFASRIDANKKTNKHEYAKCSVCKREYIKRGKKVTQI